MDRYCEKSLEGHNGRTYSGYLRERAAGAPFLVIWNTSMRGPYPPLFMSKGQLSYVRAATDNIRQILGQTNPDLTSLPGPTGFKHWQESEDKRSPFHVHAAQEKRHCIMHVTLRGKDGKFRRLFIPYPDLEAFRTLLEHFELHMGTWPGSGGLLKVPAAPIPPAAAVPQASLPPPPPPHSFDSEEDAQPDERDHWEEGPNAGYFDYDENDSEDGIDFEAARQEITGASDRYAASREDGWYYPDEDE